MHWLKKPSIYIPVGVIVVVLGIWFFAGNHSNGHVVLEPEVEESVVVTLPMPDEVVGTPLHVQGSAVLKQNILIYRLLDATGKEIVQGVTRSDAHKANEQGVFDFVIAYPEPETETGTLVIYGEGSNGSEISHTEIPLTFDQELETTTVDIFFSNALKNNDPTDCTVVFPVARRVEAGEGVERRALQALLGGHQLNDVAQGYFSNINPGVTVRNFSIDDGVATVDLSQELIFELGGECRATVIQAQITRTLEAFRSIVNVVLLIDGMPAAELLQ